MHPAGIASDGCSLLYHNRIQTGKTLFHKGRVNLLWSFRLTNSKVIPNALRCSEGVTASVLVVGVCFFLSLGSPVRSSEPTRRTLHGSFARAVRQPHPLLWKPAAGTFVHLAQCINVSLVIPIPLNATCVPDAPSKIGSSGSNMLKSVAPLRCSSMSLSAYSLYRSGISLP